MESPEYEKRMIVEYVRIESGEKITHAEKLSSEMVLGQKHDVWDVYTNKGRWWVITSPTNLYDQKEFKSMDYALSFHVGLGARMASMQGHKAPKEKIIDKLVPAWRKWEQAASMMNDIEEAEDCQAIGVVCRSALIALVKNIAEEKMIPNGKQVPKKADFINWSNYISDHLCPGESNSRVRSYLKSISVGGWELSNWLTHKESATKSEAEFVLRITEHVLVAYSDRIIEKNASPPKKCPQCGSYRIFMEYRSKGNKYFNLCEACGWEKESKQ